MATEIETPMRAKGMVHKLIAATAMGMADEHYEQLARNNRFYKAWPDRPRFVQKNWIHYIHTARSVLAGMLGNPATPDEQKAVIHEALLKDGAINPKRMAAPQKPSFFLK